MHSEPGEFENDAMYGLGADKQSVFLPRYPYDPQRPARVRLRCRIVDANKVVSGAREVLRCLTRIAVCVRELYVSHRKGTSVTRPRTEMNKGILYE